MNFFEFHGIKVSALAAAVPDRHDSIPEFATNFPPEEIQKFCETTGVWQRYNSAGLGVTTSDLCVAAAKEIFAHFDVDKDAIDGIIFVSQTPDYTVPPTSCVIQARLDLDNCGLVYDSSIGCSGFPFGLQMACANIMAGCKKVLLLVGDANPERGPLSSKDGLLFGDCGVAILLEKTEENVPPVRVAIETIGKGFKSLVAPYGMYRHIFPDLCRDRGVDTALAYIHTPFMQGADVFTFSIKDAPKTVKAFYNRFDCVATDFDLISIHQANKLIVDNVAKRIKAPMEKVQISLDRYGNTRGASTALNICDYAEQNQIYSGRKNILNVSFGVGLNIVVASIEMDMGRCLPIIKSKESFDDGITNYTYF